MQALYPVYYEWARKYHPLPSQPLTTAVYRHFLALSECSGTIRDCRDVRDLVVQITGKSFQHGTQQDAFEFPDRSFVSHWRPNVQGDYLKSRTPVYSMRTMWIFVTTRRSETATCLSCLIFTFPSPSKPFLSLSQLFERYSAIESVEGYFCASCPVRLPGLIQKVHCLHSLTSTTNNDQAIWSQWKEIGNSDSSPWNRELSRVWTCCCRRKASRASIISVTPSLMVIILVLHFILCWNLGFCAMTAKSNVFPHHLLWNSLQLLICYFMPQNQIPKFRKWAWVVSVNFRHFPQ